MKRTLFYITLGCCLLASCKHKSAEENRQEKIARFQSSLTEEDTTVMLSLCDSAMEMLKNKQIDKVCDMLYEYTDSTQEVKPITPETLKRYRNQFKTFPVLEYHRRYFSFQLEGCNDVKYDVVFATAEEAGTDKDATTGYMFNPVKVDGTWKLCVKTADDEFDHKKH